MMPATAKQTLMGCLVVCFAVQTTLVYSDEPGPPLSDEARRGYEVWHENNCQSCHQIYGYGGFLGPDLTNVAGRLGDSLEGSVEAAVRHGPGQMPVFELPDADVLALSSFLRELDRTGNGQARISASGGDVYSAFDQTVSAAIEAGAPEDAARGWALYRTRPCLGCHAPLTESPVGAPDLSTVVNTRTPEAIEAALTSGKAPRMPPPTPALSRQERGDMTAFLTWLAASRASVEAGVKQRTVEVEVDWLALPWWEYE